MGLLRAMPDLTVVYVQACVSLDREHVSHLGSRPYEQRVHLGDEARDTCTCPGFSFRKTCRHVEEARRLPCDWSSDYSEEEQTPQQEMEMKCPRCGQDTRFVRTAT